MGAGPHGGRVPGKRSMDAVDRVYEVVKRHPYVSVEWPRWSGRKEYRAHWPADPADPESPIRSVQGRDVRDLAAALEQEFPEGGGSDG